MDDFTVSNIERVVEVWVFADMYQLDGLSCMGSLLERGLCKDTVSQVLQEAEELSCPCHGLKRM